MNRVSGSDAERIETLERENAALQNARQEALRYGRKNFEAAAGFQDRALRAEARAEAAEQRAAEAERQLGEAQRAEFDRGWRSAEAEIAASLGAGIGEGDWQQLHGTKLWAQKLQSRLSASERAREEAERDTKRLDRIIESTRVHFNPYVMLPWVITDVDTLGNRGHEFRGVTLRAALDSAAAMQESGEEKA